MSRAGLMMAATALLTVVAVGGRAGGRHDRQRRPVVAHNAVATPPS